MASPPLDAAHRPVGSAIRKVAIIVMAGLAVANSGAPALAAPYQQEATATPIGDQVGLLGARKCAAFFGGLGALATQGATYTVQSEVNQAAPDAHGVQGVAGMTYEIEGLGQAATIIFAAPTEAGCEGNLVRVAPFQKTCEEVLALLPPGTVRVGDLSGVPLYHSNQDRILLVSSGPSCVVITASQASAPT